MQAQQPSLAIYALLSPAMGRRALVRTLIAAGNDAGPLPQGRA
jgi:hypothetical protein